MGTYIARRLMWTPVLLLIVSFITFALGQYGPGDPINMIDEIVSDSTIPDVSYEAPVFSEDGTTYLATIDAAAIDKIFSSPLIKFLHLIFKFFGEKGPSI